MKREFFKKFQTLGIEEIKPTGWLKEQLKVQMQGLTGYLYEMWDSVGSYSGWLGGTGENWERGPYYLDGLLPLAYLLQDEKAWKISEKFVAWTLDSQDADGNFGPATSKNDWWSRVVMLKVLVQYYEITKEQKIIKFMHKYYKFQLKEMPKRPLTQWGKARGADLIYCIKWLYEREPEDYLLDLIEIIKGQSLDWNNLFEEFPFTRPTGYYYDWEKLSMFSWEMITEMMQYQATHIVNVTMGLKFPAIIAWMDNKEELYQLQRKAIDELKKYHGVVSGAINGDEHLSGNSPSQGAELCSIVEYMFSLQIIMEIFGDAKYGDLLERLAYNALPATITEDYMGHQYLQQANQVLVTNEKRNWFNNLSDSNTFGLEPNFGCCTANMHQGWPKFLKSFWYKQENTLISMVFAPNKLETIINNQKIEIETITNYPSDGFICYQIIHAKHVAVQMKVRQPEWCYQYTFAINGESHPYVEEDGFIIFDVTLNTGDKISFEFEMEVKISTWRNNSIGVQRGPLIYALDIEEEWKVYKEVGNVKDYEIRPKSNWNYALMLDGKFEVEIHSSVGIPFKKDNPPVIIQTQARRLDNWRIEKGSAQDVPTSPVQSSNTTENVRLIPFGCTKLRVAQFPYFNSCD